MARKKSKKKFDFNQWLEDWVNPAVPAEWISIYPRDGGIVMTCNCGKCYQAYGNTLEDVCAAFEKVAVYDQDGDKWKSGDSDNDEEDGESIV